MAREEVELVGTAETGDLEQSLDRVAAKADRAGRAFKNADKEGAAKLKGGIEGVKKSAEAIQGPLGGMTSRVIAAGEAAAQFATKAGPVGVVLAGIAATALGGAGTIYALTSLTSAAIEAEKRLDDLRKVGAGIPEQMDDSAGSLDDLALAWDEFSIAVDRFVSFYGSQFAPAVAAGVREIAFWTNKVTDASMALDLWLEKLLPTNKALLDFLGTVGKTTDRSNRYAEAAKAVADSQKAIAEHSERVEKITRSMTDARKRATDAEREAAKQNREWLAQLRRDFKLWDLQAQRLEQANRYLGEHADAWREISDDLGAGILALRAANEELRIMEVLAGVVADKFVNFSAVAAPSIDALNTTIGAFAQGTQRDLAAVEAEIAELELRDDEHAKARLARRQQEAALLRTEAMNQWRLQQGLQIAQASAAAFTAASLALANPPGPPATVPVAAAALAAGLANVAQIVATKPQFHMGGQVGRTGAPAPDEADIRVRRNETVMTRQQMRNMGSGAPLRATFRLKHRVIDEVQADNLNTPGSRSATAAARGNRSGHWRRRG